MIFKGKTNEWCQISIFSSKLSRIIIPPPRGEGGGGVILKNVLIQKVQTELQRLENLREVRMEEVEGMLNTINNLYQKLNIPGAGLEAYPYCF